MSVATSSARASLHRRRTWLAAVLLMLLGQALLSAVGSPRFDPWWSLAAWAIAGSGWTLAVRAVLRGDVGLSLRTLCLVALGLRLIAFAGEPSDDLARYVWEGRVQLAGVDPYRVPPAAEELGALAASAPEFAQINHPEWTAIYPPLTQLLQRALVAIAPSVWSFRIALLLAEAALVALLIGELRRRGQAPQRVLIYAWSPLAVFASAHEVHSDVFAVVLLVASLSALVRQRAFLAGLLASGAALAKLLPLAATPALLTDSRLATDADSRSESREAANATPSTASTHRPQWLALLAGALVGGAALCWPLRHSGAALWASFTRFGSELHFNDALPSVLRASLGERVTPWVLAGLGLTAALWIWRRAPQDVFLRAALLIATLLLLLPTLHPWYLVLLLPFLVLFPWWGWLALTLSSALTWLAFLELRRTGQWVEWPWLKVPEYAPLVLWLALRVVRRSAPRALSRSST